MTLFELIDKSKRHLRFSKTEINSLLISSGILGLMLSFRDFSLGNYIIFTIVALLRLGFHISVQKMLALYIGFTAEFRLWWYGLLGGLLVVFASNGRLWWLVLPGGVVFSLLARHRLGRFRYGLNYLPMGIIGFGGSVASIIFGTVFKNVEIYILGTTSPLLHTIFIFNLALAVGTMLPIPPLNGHYMFFASRLWYALLFGIIFSYTIFVLVFGFFSWIWAIIGGGVIWLGYYIKFESEWW